MPIYMDRHDIPGVSAEAVAAAHQEDLKIQHQYQCKGLTYWFDEDKGMAFCLIEAPDKASVKKLHDDAHGLIPHQIIEVDSELVESFLGRIEDPEHADKELDTDYVVINDPAFRAIMLVDLNIIPENSSSKLVNSNDIIETFNGIFSTALNNYSGKKVEHMDEGCMASFSSINQSIKCALEIQDRIRHFNKSNSRPKIYMRIGLSAGEPIEGEDDLFGPTVRLARQLCALCPAGKIMADATINDLYNHRMFSINDNDPSLIFLKSDDEKFINILMPVVEQNWKDPLFGMETLRQKLGMSKSQLYRKIKILLNHSTSDFIRAYRLHNAVKALIQQKGSITDIAYECGFSSQSYFTKCFLKRYGVTPSEFASTV